MQTQRSLFILHKSAVSNAGISNAPEGVTVFAWMRTDPLKARQAGLVHL